ncbi:MAG TPA: DUF1499 domain-containing protein [Verrucomicrobiae bacterium]|nr:DUF1499 domain-containing protein [Verrucomicrobiae bacterium]
MFKLSGKRPRDLGVSDGQFTAAKTWKPNWVSSQVDPSDKHHVAPLPGGQDPKAVLAKLARAIEEMPRSVIVERKPDYLRVECSTPLMGYTDDVELHAAAGVVHVRSSSRLGIRDFDVNRKRVEALRGKL